MTEPGESKAAQKRGPLQDAQLNQRIGYRVFKERERRGLTVVILARRAGIHKNTIYRVEQGIGISVCGLVRIAAALDMTVDELLALSQTIVSYGKNDASRGQKVVKVVCGTGSLFREPGSRPVHPASPAQRPEAIKS